MDYRLNVYSSNWSKLMHAWYISDSIMNTMCIDIAIFFLQYKVLILEDITPNNKISLANIDCPPQMLISVPRNGSYRYFYNISCQLFVLYCLFFLIFCLSVCWSFCLSFCPAVWLTCWSVHMSEEFKLIIITRFLLDLVLLGFPIVFF